MRGDKKTIRIFWTLFAFNALFYIPGATFGAYIGVYYRSCAITGRIPLRCLPYVCSFTAFLTVR